MKRTTKIIVGIALLAFGIGWALNLVGILHVSYRLDGWWTLFIIIPCLAALIDSKHKVLPLAGFGVGVLLLLATLEIVSWNDFWKYVLCLLAVIWGLSLLFGRGRCGWRGESACQADGALRQVEQDGRTIRKIGFSFGKHLYDFSGQRFEGADVQTSFGFTALDLRNADLLDGAVINVDCSFGGMEIRVGGDVCVHNAIKSSFAGVECNCGAQPADGMRTLYLTGRCSFGGIEVKG